MRRFILFSSTLIIITATFIFSLVTKRDDGKKDYAIAVHGGAGYFDEKTPPEVVKLYEDALSAALDRGKKMLEEGTAAIDVAEAVVRMLEDDSLFNAGRGAVLNSEGVAELDASIMDGATKKAGAVAGVKIIKNPVTAARKIMDETKHLLLVAEGAEKFAVSKGLETVPNSYFVTWSRERDLRKGTVGVVVLDKKGNLAAATSTGGMGGKMPGRVGDSPIIGAGTYADNKTCAVSCTGWGEKFIVNGVAISVAHLMEYRNLSLEEAVNYVFKNNLKEKDGGLIALDKNGNAVMKFNTKSMFRGYVSSDGVKEVKIWP